MQKTKNIYFAIPVMFFMAGILFSCVNDLETIEKVTYNSKAPDEVTKNIEILYTDSGYAQVRIQATLAETYKFPQRVTKLKDGLKVDFFSAEGKIGSTLTALYGEVNHVTGIMFVRDSVSLYNYEKKQTLETEELFYNQQDSSVYTNKYVVIKREGKGITGHGNGIQTSHAFRNYVITKPDAKIYD